VEAAPPSPPLRSPHICNAVTSTCNAYCALFGFLTRHRPAMNAYPLDTTTNAYSNTHANTLASTFTLMCRVSCPTHPFPYPAFFLPCYFFLRTVHHQYTDVAPSAAFVFPAWRSPDPQLLPTLASLAPTVLHAAWVAAGLLGFNICSAGHVHDICVFLLLLLSWQMDAPCPNATPLRQANLKRHDRRPQ